MSNRFKYHFMINKLNFTLNSQCNRTSTLSPKNVYSTNQKQLPACALARARVTWRFPGSPAMARDGELIQTQYFCHHADIICHPNSTYVTTKLYETSACECSNNTIFQNELFSRFLPSTYVAWQRRSLCDAAKIARWLY